MNFKTELAKLNQMHEMTINSHKTLYGKQTEKEQHMNDYIRGCLKAYDSGCEEPYASAEALDRFSDRDEYVEYLKEDVEYIISRQIYDNDGKWVRCLDSDELTAKEMENQKLSNQQIFINNWINKYYCEGSEEENGNKDYLKAEAEKEYFITIGLDEWAGEQMYEHNRKPIQFENKGYEVDDLNDCYYSEGENFPGQYCDDCYNNGKLNKVTHELDTFQGYTFFCDNCYEAYKKDLHDEEYDNDNDDLSETSQESEEKDIFDKYYYDPDYDESYDEQYKNYLQEKKTGLSKIPKSIYNRNELWLIKELDELNELQGDYKLTYCVHGPKQFIDVESVYNKTINFHEIENIVRTLKGEYDWEGLSLKVLSASGTNIKTDITRRLYLGIDEKFYRKYQNGVFRSVEIYIETATCYYDN